MSYIDPKDIPQSLLPPGPSRKKETDAIRTLSAYSFVNRRPAGLALDLHRLVHLETWNWLRKEGLLAQSTERVIVRLEGVFPDYNHENRSVWRVGLPYAHYALGSNLVDNYKKIRTDLAWKYRMCLYSDGQWDEGEDLFTQVIEIQKRVLSVEHLDTLTYINTLVLTYTNQDRWEEAEELGKEVMEIQKRVLSTEHPTTPINMANLVSTLWNQGQWDQAEELEVRVMEIQKRVPGAEHLDTLTSINNLAITWKGHGQDTEAMSLIKECVQLRKRILGVNHPLFLSSFMVLV